MKNTIKKYKHILFDFDKTIATVDVDWSKWHIGAGKIFQKYEPEFRLHLDGQKIYHLQNEMFQKYGGNLKKEIDVFTREFERDEVRGIIPIDKTISFLNESFIEGLVIHLWSSNDSVLIEKSLKSLGIHDKFKLVVTRDKVDYLKPNRSAFDLYFSNLDSDLGTFLMIGDSDADRGAAKECNINYLDVTEL